MFLIVNADDFGYSPGVTRGILDAARDGVVTATGVMPNSPYFDEHVGWLSDAPELDIGVHLTVTHGLPLTARMADLLAGWNRETFPRKYEAVRRLISGSLRVADVEEEWTAQIDRCLEAGLRIRFLNSHEHLHIFPSLAKLIRRLADNLRIPHTRVLAPEWRECRTPAAIARSAVADAAERINRRASRDPHPELVGLSYSGRLNMAYMERRIRSMKPGGVYELMCHPGHYAPGEIKDDYLLSYHDWEGELRLLRSADMRRLLESNKVRLVGYRDLVRDRDRLTVRSPGAEA